MAGVRAVRVMLEVVTVEEGLWCRPCALPSGARFWFTTGVGPRLVLHSKVQCRDCGGTDVDGDA